MNVRGKSSTKCYPLPPLGNNRISESPNNHDCKRPPRLFPRLNFINMLSRPDPKQIGFHYQCQGLMNLAPAPQYLQLVYDLQKPPLANILDKFSNSCLEKAGLYLRSTPLNCGTSVFHYCTSYFVTYLNIMDKRMRKYKEKSGKSLKIQKQ